MTRIISISSSRADIGVLMSVWDALTRDAGVELHVLLTGMHLLAPDAGRALVCEPATAHLGGADLGGASGVEAAEAMAKICRFAGRVYAAHDFDLVLAIGDRLDMLPAVQAAIPFGVPVAHLHGGELTLGAVDDRVRHAISKLAHIHCVASVEAAERLNAMGEEAWRIHVTGGPGLDMLAAQSQVTASAFATEVGLATLDGLRLVTVHPETLSGSPAGSLRAVLAALDRRPGATLFTAPNSDPGGSAMWRDIEAFVAKRDWAVFVDTLGSLLYANAMRLAEVMVGNSSSGLIEAPLFGLPAINIGKRQDGRARADNVIDCAAAPDEIVAALDRIDPARRSYLGVSPYGDGRAAARVAAALVDLPDRERLLYKRFETARSQFEAPWQAHTDFNDRKVV